MIADLPEPDDLLRCIGPPLAGSFATLLGPHSDVGAAVGAYRERFGEDGIFEAEIAIEMIKTADREPHRRAARHAKACKGIQKHTES